MACEAEQRGRNVNPICRSWLCDPPTKRCSRCGKSREAQRDGASWCPGSGCVGRRCAGQSQGENSSRKHRKTGAAQCQSQMLLLTTAVAVVVSAFKTICKEPSNIPGLLFIFDFYEEK